MRRICKYKNYSKSRLPIKKFCLRLFNFKKTKWKRIQSISKKNKNFFPGRKKSRFHVKFKAKKTTSFNIQKIKVKQKRWSRLKNTFRNRLEKKDFFLIFLAEVFFF